MSYDSIGNIKTKTLGSQALTYSYNSSTNRLNTVTGGYSFSYDGRGTVLHNGKRGFSVNRANQMTGSDGVSYSYDGHNRRVKKVNGGKTQYSFYSQSGQFLSTTGTNGPTEYVYLGSQLVAQVSQVATADDKPGYTGHLEDKDIGLTYMQQRYYDPVIGRFYSNDPVGFMTSNPMMFNRYAYANNNPFKYVDPDGNSPKVAKSLFNIAKNTFKSGGDIRSASRDELISVVQNVAELADGDWTPDDVFAAVDLLTGFGEEAKNLKKTYFSTKQRKEAFDKADGKCEYCGNKTDFDTPFKPNSAEADHDIPQASGGLTTEANRKNSCRSCNGPSGKGGKMSGKEWKTKLGSRIKERV